MWMDVSGQRGTIVRDGESYQKACNFMLNSIYNSRIRADGATGRIANFWPSL